MRHWRFSYAYKPNSVLRCLATGKGQSFILSCDCSHDLCVTPFKYTRGNSKGTDLHRGKDFAVSLLGSLRGFILRGASIIADLALMRGMPFAFALGVTARTSQFASLHCRDVFQHEQCLLRLRRELPATLLECSFLPLIALAGRESSHSLCSDFPLSLPCICKRKVERLSGTYILYHILCKKAKYRQSGDSQEKQKAPRHVKTCPQRRIGPRLSAPDVRRVLHIPRPDFRGSDGQGECPRLDIVRKSAKGSHGIDLVAQ